MISQKLSVLAFANTFAIIDLVLHPLFRLWIWLEPHTYERAMNLFVAGLRVEVTNFDLSIGNMIIGTILEAAGFWIFGALVASLYNLLVEKTQRK